MRSYLRLTPEVLSPGTGFSRSSRSGTLSRLPGVMEGQVPQLQERLLFIPAQQQFLPDRHFAVLRVLFPNGRAAKANGIVGMSPGKRRNHRQQNLPEILQAKIGGRMQNGGHPEQIAQLLG